MGKITNRAIRSRQPTDRLAADLNLRKSRAVAAPATGDVAAVASHRAAHEQAHAALAVSGDVPALATASMGRRPHGGHDGSQPRPDGGLGGAVSD